MRCHPCWPGGSPRGWRRTSMKRFRMRPWSLEPNCTTHNPRWHDASRIAMTDPEVARGDLLQCLRLLVDRLSELEREIAAGVAGREELEELTAELRGLDVRLFGPRPKHRRG